MKSLILATMLTGAVGFTQPLNTNSGTTYQDVNITETYEYETNDVNSVDDIVIGNIYKFDMNLDNLNNNHSLYIDLMYKFNAQANNILNYTDLEITILNSLNDADLRIYFNDTNIYVQRFVNNVKQTDYIIIDNTNYSHVSFYVIISQNTLDTFFVNYLSASDYLGEKTITITPIEYDGLYSIFENFLHERIFSGGQLDEIEFEIFNTTMTMGQWLSCTTSIVLLSLIIILLVLLIKFIFKYVGGMMIWK